MKRLIKLFTAMWERSIKSDSGENDALNLFYEKDGHLDTTILIARMAGFTPIEAMELGYYSQAPDESFKYDAVKVGIWGFFYLPYRQKIMKILHSLHGGNTEKVMARRRWLLSKISTFDYQDKINLWKLGFLIHATGDAYAHTYKKNGKEYAYNPWIGHIFAPTCEKGKTPDLIMADPEKYNQYTSDLLVALKVVKKNDDPSKALIKELHDLILLESKNPLDCETDYHQNIKNLLKGKSLSNELNSLKIPDEIFGESEKNQPNWSSTFNFWKVRKFLVELSKDLNSTSAYKA